MAQLVVRNLEDAVKRKLRERAVRHGRSMEEEVRHILGSSVRDESAPSPSLGLGSRIAARFRGIGLDQDIPEMRDEPLRPASFED